MKTVLAALLVVLFTIPAWAQQSTWLWWGATNPIPVSAANPLPVTGAGGNPAAPLSSLQFNNSGAFGGSSFTYAPDQIAATVISGTTPSFVGSDSTSGFGFGSDGRPTMWGRNGANIQVDVGANSAQSQDALTITANGNNSTFGIVAAPAVGKAGEFEFLVDSFGTDNEPIIGLQIARGVNGTPTALADGQIIFQQYMRGYDGATYGAQINLIGHARSGAALGADFSIAVTDKVTGVPNLRLVIDDLGNTNIENGHLLLVNTAPTVASDAGTPTLDATASDTAGVVTVGAASTTTTVTFHSAFATAPHVIASNPDGTISGLSYVVTTGHIVFTYTLNTGGVIDWIALG